MPGAFAPPVAVTMPPSTTMLSALSSVELMPPPMPAALSPPCAVTVPPDRRILPGGGLPPREPMPAPYLPPVAARVPEPETASVAFEATSMPAA